ncbi:MAG: AAA family ATPase, partial [Planctomycetota bacterium]
SGLSVSFVCPEIDGCGQDGEADFLILHPTKGIVVLEAKGGEIEADGDCWFTRKGRDRRSLKQTPMRQAQDSKHALLGRFLAMRHLRTRLLHLVHAIALPHVAVPPSGLGLDAPRERILDARDLGSVTAWVEQVLRSADPPHIDRPPLGSDGVQRIVDAVSLKRDLAHWTPAVAKRTRERLATLTEEQYDVLRSIASFDRVRVQGGPGTGKTLLALESARRMAAQGLETLLVCFNAPLGGHLREVVHGIEGLTATHFHQLCRDRATQAGLGASMARAEAAGAYDTDFPALLFDAAMALDRPFDAIVVDEAQDFRETWWTALDACLEGGASGRLTLFADERQQLSEDAPGAGPDGVEGPLFLTQNCRNPDEIHRFLAACPGGPEGLRPSGVTTGILPCLHWVGKPGRTPRLVSRVVAHLMRDHGVEPSEIAVLTPRAPSNSQLGKVERLGPAPCVWRKRSDEHQVLIDTIHRFKGLEATAVVLAEITPDVRPDLPTHLRVGCSRPTVHLEILASPDTAEHLGDALDFADVVEE